jgi:tRNA-splicing ligase RtcB
MRELIEQGKAPIRLWEPAGSPMEPEVLQQVRNVAQLPVTEAVCLMPDGHWGKGGPVGGVIATRSAIVPALVGVDIGCGMIAQELELPASALDGKLLALRRSGSRGPGNRIGTYFIEQARTYALKQHRTLPDRDLGWLDDGTVLFDDYGRAVLWAQRYAQTNRAVMMRIVLDAIAVTLGRPIQGRAHAVNCHHNYVEEREAGLYVTRKGAVSARQGELGIIPGSMGAQSFIVAGRGAPASYESCSHGAGRRLSRSRAKRELSLADHAAATAGVECRKDAGVLDESPGAYKDIAAVMAAQADLVEVVATLKQVVCVKG